jgi:hypothetical protein
VAILQWINAQAFGNRDAVRQLWLGEWLMILSCQQGCPEFCVDDLVLFLGTGRWGREYFNLARQAASR